MDALHYNLPEDEKNLRKARLECKKELMQLYDKYKHKEEEYFEMNKKLKSEKTQIKKLLMQK
jgi:lysyl-tRNA synthetase class I